MDAIFFDHQKPCMLPFLWSLGFGCTTVSILSLIHYEVFYEVIRLKELKNLQREVLVEIVTDIEKQLFAKGVIAFCQMLLSVGSLQYENKER